MPVIVARNAGFCMGVRRAVDGALEAARTKGSVVSWGAVAHNPEVISHLAESGVEVIGEVEQARGKTVLIRSHGVAPRVLEALREVALEVVDLTCPFVERLHRAVREYSRDGGCVILVGCGTHPEVIGTVGCAGGQVITLETVEEARSLPPMQAALAVSQTTFPREGWEKILPILRQRVENLTVKDTICTATALRQQEAAGMAAQVDAMLVVGGRESANTRKLFETCLARCPRTLLVERASEIPAGFANTQSESIGITAGASTPDWSLKEVVTRMTDKEVLNQQVSTEEAENSSFMADVEATLVRIKPGQTITGIVELINEDEVGVNIGYKSDGLIKREDLVTEDVKVGDEIEVEVVKVNDGEGNVILSQRNMITKKAFAELVEKNNNGEYIEGTGSKVVKGGLICMVNGIQAFVPASQLSNRYVEKIDDFVGKDMKLKIIEIDEQKRRVVASRKAVIKEEAAARKAEAWSKIVEGEVIHGVVRRLTSFGAFVDLGGVDGLIHVTDLSWAHVKDPADVVAPDQEVDVKILSVDPEKERIALGLKQLQPKPWDVAPEKYPEGAVITGKVVRITTFGAFVELEPGIDGLIHISQCAATRINKVEDAVNVGDVVTVKVLSIDPAAKRISLSIRALLEPETPVVEEEAAPVVEDDNEEAVPVDIEAVGAALEAEANE